MGKCVKVKNPCNVCLQAVSKKTGLQCQGACKKWAHYVCLNYTPGHIQDIKRGIITVWCPCPNCSTTEPKEYLTNPPFSCTNPTCPANDHPRCVDDDCPAYFPIPAAPIMHQCPSGIKLQMIPSSDSSTCPPPPCGPDPPCASSVSSTVIPPSCPVTRPVCPVGQVKKTKSCSCASKEGDIDSKIKLLKTSSDTNMSSSNSVYVTMQEMCNTVGQLSTQLKQLMCKMMDTVPNT